MSYLLSAVPGQDIAALLERAHAALRPGGKLILHDFMLDEAGDGPLSAALFFLAYLANDPDTVSFAPSEVVRWAEAAGFVDAGAEPMIPDITMMVTATKPNGRWRAGSR